MLAPDDGELPGFLSQLRQRHAGIRDPVSGGGARAALQALLFPADVLAASQQQGQVRRKWRRHGYGAVCGIGWVRVRLELPVRKACRCMIGGGRSSGSVRSSLRPHLPPRTFCRARRQATRWTSSCRLPQVGAGRCSNRGTQTSWYAHACFLPLVLHPAPVFARILVSRRCPVPLSC